MYYDVQRGGEAYRCKFVQGDKLNYRCLRRGKGI